MAGIVPGSANARVPLASRAGAPADEDARLERARRMYKEGRVAYERGRYEEAADKFTVAYDLAGDPNLLFNLALVYDRLEQLDRALEYMKRYRTLAPDDEHEALDARIEGLQARIAEQADAPKDPPKDPPTDLPQDPPVDPVPTDDPNPMTDDTLPRYRVFNGTAIGLTATAGVLLATGVGLGAASLTRTRAANEGCEDVEGSTFCLGEVEGDVAASQKLALASDITVAIGAAVGIAAIVVIAVRAKRKKSMDQAWRLGPTGLTYRF